MGALLAGLLLAQAGPVRAADESPAGSWKFTLPFQGASWLVKLETKDGKWTGTALAGEKTPEAKVQDVSVVNGALKFTLKLERQGVSLPFEGAVPKTGDKLLGSIALGGKVFPAQLEKTTLTSFDPYDVTKDDLAKQKGDAAGVRMILELLSQAAEKKATPDEVRSWAEKAAKWAAPYGQRWQREITIAVAEILSEQEGYAPIALQYARQAEKSLNAKKDSPGLQRRVLRALAAALNKSDKKDEAKAVELRLEKIPVVVAPPFPGRKNKSDRVVLVELFTGAQCPPCVTADVAFDALMKTYPPRDAVFLEYHLNIPRPDPMTNKDTEERERYYGKAIEGTPTMFVNGKVGPPPGGRGEDDAQGKYDEYSALIQPLLEKPAKAQLKVATKVAEGKTHVRVEVSDLAETGDGRASAAGAGRGTGGVQGRQPRGTSSSGGPRLRGRRRRGWHSAEREDRPRGDGHRPERRAQESEGLHEVLGGRHRSVLRQGAGGAFEEPASGGVRAERRHRRDSASGAGGFTDGVKAQHLFSRDPKGSASPTRSPSGRG